MADPRDVSPAEVTEAKAMLASMRHYDRILAPIRKLHLSRRVPLRASNSMTTRWLGAMGECDARTQGASICGHIGATEDEAACRPARPDGSLLH